MRKLALFTIVGLLVLGFASSALANNVPNDKNWHIHDGGTTGVGDHHKGLVFFPALFLQEGGLVYGSDDAPFVWCPNATDKGLLSPGGQGEVRVAGHCKSDVYIVHLLSGVDAPAGWSTVEGTDVHYRLTPRG